MIDFAGKYSSQNKILDIYLKNAGVGTVVIETNHQVTGMQICQHLDANYHMRTVNYELLTEGIVNFLRETGQRKEQSERQICIYNFPTDSDTIDVIQSLNISRELLRTIDRLILVMPTLLVEQIRTREPNLRDYIGLFLDYNTKNNLPFEPVFDVPFKKRFTRDEQKSLKGSVRSLHGRSDLQQYFRYINQFCNRKLSRHECYETLLPAFQDLLKEFNYHSWEGMSDYIQAVEDLLYRTAAVLAVQQYYELAIRQFEMILKVGSQKTNGENMHILHGLEGISYCSYWMRDYDRAERSLLYAVQILRNMETDNEAWICRLYSNYAACCIRRGDYQKAQSISEMCLSMLTEYGQMNPERETRARMNLMICQMERGEIAEIYTGGWQQYLDKIKAEQGTDSINYVSCLLMDAWYRSVLLGANKEALAEAKEALGKNRFLLEENSYDLAVNYMVLEKIYNQMGDSENEKLVNIKKTNILRTCRSPYQTRE